MEKRWSKAELAHLKRYAKSQSIEELAQKFHADVATVRNKLAELGLGGTEGSSASEEAALEAFTQALELLHSQRWDEAAKLLEKVITESDGLHLADRARQHLEICRQRTAKAAEDGDPYLRAVFEKNRGNLERALDLCLRQDGAKDQEHFAYLMASIRALEGAEDEALDLLATAIRLEPKNRVHAFHDSDFRTLHGREEFSQLVQAP